MEMEPIAPISKRFRSRKPFDKGGAAADCNKFRELPESVVHRIFSFLGTMDVIRASAVSTNWRYLWTSMPHLDFDYEYIRPCPLSDYDKFKDFVNWVLMTHDKSVNIKSCRLSCLNNEDDYSIHRWLRILVQKHVQELCLTVTSDTNTESLFALPRCLFASDSLEVLELNVWYCVFKTPSYAGFGRLKSLKLRGAFLYDQNLFQNFISSCPLLENLSLMECLFLHFKVLDISLRNLRKLVIEFDGSVEGLSKCDLKITCPKLVHFDLTGALAKSLSWGKNPCFLQTAILYPSWNDGDDDFDDDDDDQNEDDDDDQVPNDEFANLVLEILREVCRVEVLKLRINILEYSSPEVAKPWCFSTIFYNLKTLRLCIGMEACYIQSMIYLLKCAPTLQLLSIYIDRYKGCDYKCKMMDGDIACLTCHLKMVKLIGITDNQLELIKFFLKNGLVLEKMNVIWRHHFNGETQRKSIQKVMKFPRSSSPVNVTFSEPKQLGEHEL